MEMKDNNYRQFKWGGTYRSLELLIYDLLVQIQSSLVIAGNWQVWGQGVSHQFPMGKHPSLNPPWYLLSFLGLRWQCFLVWFILGFSVVVCIFGVFCLLWVPPTPAPPFFFSSLNHQTPRIPDQPSYSATEIAGKLCCTCSTIGEHFSIQDC